MRVFICADTAFLYTVNAHIVQACNQTVETQRREPKLLSYKKIMIEKKNEVEH